MSSRTRPAGGRPRRHRAESVYGLPRDLSIPGGRWAVFGYECPIEGCDVRTSVAAHANYDALNYPEGGRCPEHDVERRVVARTVLSPTADVERAVRERDAALSRAHRAEVEVAALRERRANVGRLLELLEGAWWIEAGEIVRALRGEADEDDGLAAEDVAP